MRYWLIVHDLESYSEHPNLIGSTTADRTFRSIRPGDRIVFYAVGKKLVGLFKISKPGRILGKDRYWDPHSLVYEIEPVLLPPCPLDFKPYEFGLKMLRKAASKLTEDEYKKIALWLLGFKEFPEKMNHDMLVAFFIKMHPNLGYLRIKFIQPQFPDCIVLDKKGREVRIEFEVMATDFQRDESHQIDKCDQIICWEDDWGATAPEGKVLSLKEWLFG